MTSSAACSSSAARLALALGATLALAGCRHAAPAGTARPGPIRIAVLPVDNEAAGPAPLAELLGAVEAGFAALPGVEVVGGQRIQEFLARQRMRYTGGVDARAAAAAREQLGVDAVLVTTLVHHQPDPPTLGLLARLVGASDDVPILWTGGASRAWNDSPGLLGLGVVGSMAELRTDVVGGLARSMRAALDGRGPRATACDDGRTYRPRVGYRSTLLDPAKPVSVAVVPFRNLSPRRNAGEVVALEFARQLATNPSFRVVEPGVTRDALLRNRVVMEGGVSVDQVRTLLRAIGADLVVAGDVTDFLDGVAGSPVVNFTATALDAESGLIAWQTMSSNRGDDAVYFFGLGRVRTAGALACRMVRSAVDTMSQLRPRPPPEAARSRSERISR